MNTAVPSPPRGLVLVALALPLLAGCGDPEVEPSLEPPDIFEVGVRTLTFVDDTRDDRDGNVRTLPIEVWYPAVPAARVHPRDAYDMTAEAPDDLEELVCGVNMPVLSQAAARDVDLETSFGPYPLLIFSHGKNGIRFQTHSLMTHLASHGYIVVAPDHTDDTIWELIRDAEIDPGLIIGFLVDRTIDVGFVNDQIRVTAPFADVLEGEAYGIFGHSFGGAVSVVMTSSTCEFYDERIIASMPLAPAAGFMPIMECGVDQSTAPTLILGGMLDRTTPYVFDQLDPYGTAPEPKGLVGIHAAGHFSFTELCELDMLNLANQIGLDAENVVTDGCGPEFLEPADQQRLQNYFGEHFFNAFMRNDAEARAALAPEAVPEEILAMADYVEEGLAP